MKEDKMQILQEIKLAPGFDLINLDETRLKRFAEIQYQSFSQSRKEVDTMAGQFKLGYERLLAKCSELAPQTVKFRRHKVLKKAEISKFTGLGSSRLLLIGTNNEMQFMPYQAYRELQRRKLFRQIYQFIKTAFQDVDTFLYEFSWAAEQLPLLFGQGISLTYVQAYEEKIHSRILYINYLFAQLNDYALCYDELIDREWQVCTEIQRGRGVPEQQARLEHERCLRCYQRLDRLHGPLQLLIEQLLLSAGEVSDSIKKTMTQSTMARAAAEVVSRKAELQAERQKRLMKEVEQEDEIAETVRFEADRDRTEALKSDKGVAIISKKDKDRTEKSVQKKLGKAALLVGCILVVFLVLYFLYMR